MCFEYCIGIFYASNKVSWVILHQIKIQIHIVVYYIHSNDIRNDMLHTYGVLLNYVKSWRLKEQTLKIIRGDPTDLFSKILVFFFILHQTNLRTVTVIKFDDHDRFKYYFMALGASIRGWEHCRPTGTYLNGYYGGTLFTICTQDANSNIFILAFRIWDN